MVAAQPWGAANKPNMNVSWMRDRSAWVIYILALAGFRYFVSITWLVLHYHKGSAFYTERQDLLKKTLWEQIDDGKAYTPTKKFLTLVPIVLFILTWHVNEMQFDFVNILNWLAVAILVGSKLPQFHGVRLFGINRD